MLVNLFILGPPGSGKSTACRTIHDYILRHHRIRHIARLSDYDILWEMFLDDLQLHPPALRRFEPTQEHSGFNIKPHAYSVFDEALHRVSAQMKTWLAGEIQWLMTEFSRNNYIHAFAQFELSLLKNAHFLFITAQQELCRERLRKRIRHPATPDDHFVSDYILATYYYRATSELSIMDFCKTYGIEAPRIKVISNNGSLEDFVRDIRRFVDTIVNL